MGKTLDLGCGNNPKNPFLMDDVYGVDIRDDLNKNILMADISIEAIPFETDYFDYVTAYDVIEHIPRVIYNPSRRFCFVELMNEIYRVLKNDGIFYSQTPAYPSAEAFQDPTHCNFITQETLKLYFTGHRVAHMYGFKGNFELIEQKWNDSKTHLIVSLKKISNL